MFDCMNGLLPTPLLDNFTTNATIHAHHTRQRNIPHATQTFGTISEMSVTRDEPTTWTEIPQTIRVYQNKNIFTRLLKKNRLHRQVGLQLNVLYYTELLGTINALSVCRCHAWVCGGGGGVCRLAGWVCLGETRVFLCLFACLDVLCAVMCRLGAPCFLPACCASPSQ